MYECSVTSRKPIEALETKGSAKQIDSSELVYATELTDSLEPVDNLGQINSKEPKD